MNSAKLRAGLALLLTFTVGAAAGALGSGAWRHAQMRKHLNGDPETMHMRMAQHMLAKRLSLNAEQQAKLEVIFASHSGELKELRALQEPKMVEIQKKIAGELREILSEPQKREFEKIEQERSKRHRR
jgi:Spy/CpxP family protein refolding chaperone